MSLLLALPVATWAAEGSHFDTERIEPRGVNHPGTRVAQPDVAAASDEARQALSRMKLPAGFSASLWAAEPMLANPVAFNLDDHGRVYVAETHRYRTSVFDIRDYMWMLEDDLACRTIEDRTALIQRLFGEAGVKELSQEGELIRVLEDRDGDGVADFSGVYADGFNAPLDGIASGVIARRGQVWFANIPSVWRFNGTVRGVKRTEIARGFGVRFNFTGHDLHGLAWGPDGKLYYSVGDRGAHVSTPAGGAVDLPDTGGIFRSNPDGTDLELVASGLRNPQSLLFTENGDLFTGDNDSDQGDEERLVHVLEGSDSGWRVGYQFAPLGSAGPWNTEKLWHPRHPGQPAYLVPPVANIEDGPSGIAYYPGTGLRADYAGSIFITHFKGSIASSGIYRYTLQPAGASYTVATAAPFLTSALPTDVKFGPDGRLYYSDWAEGWPKSRKGRLYAIADTTAAADPRIAETRTLLASDWRTASVDELTRRLAHPDWRVRLEAQFTFAERGAASLAPLAAVLASPAAAPFARRHAIWGLGQLAAHDPAALAPLVAALADADPELRAQALKTLGDRGAVAQTDAFMAALADEHPRVRYFAAQSLGKLRAPAAVPALLAAVRAEADRDVALRHALTLALSRTAAPADLVATATDPSPSVRLAAVLALRRQQHPGIARFLADPAPAIVRETALAINDAPIVDALPALAALLAGNSTDDAVILRAINAHFRLGTPADVAALAAYAARAVAPARLRAEALAQLALWARPPARDRLVGIYRPLIPAARDAAVARDAILGLLPALLAVDAPDTVSGAAVATLVALEARAAGPALTAFVRATAAPAAARAAALAALDALHDADLAATVRFAAESDSPALRLAALPITARLDPTHIGPLLARLIAGSDAAARKAAYRTLGDLQDPIADRLLADELQALARGQIPAAVQLELVEAAAQRTDDNVKWLLTERAHAHAVGGDPLAPFRVALEGGDAKAGERVFYRQPIMACVKCHRADRDGGDAGPSLEGIGAARTRDDLLESVIKPNARIAPGFDTQVITLRSGAVLAGTLAGETAAELRLRDAAGQIATVALADVKSREAAPSSMPEIYATILTKTELRDVVAFLASLDTAPLADEHAHRPRALREKP